MTATDITLVLRRHSSYFEWQLTAGGKVITYMVQTLARPDLAAAQQWADRAIADRRQQHATSWTKTGTDTYRATAFIDLYQDPRS